MTLAAPRCRELFPNGFEFDLAFHELTFEFDRVVRFSLGIHLQLGQGTVPDSQILLQSRHPVRLLLQRGFQLSDLHAIVRDPCRVGPAEVASHSNHKQNSQSDCPWQRKRAGGGDWRKQVVHPFAWLKAWPGGIFEGAVIRN